MSRRPDFFTDKIGKVQKIKMSYHKDMGLVVSGYMKSGDVERAYKRAKSYSSTIEYSRGAISSFLRRRYRIYQFPTDSDNIRIKMNYCVAFVCLCLSGGVVSKALYINKKFEQEYVAPKCKCEDCMKKLRGNKKVKKMNI